MTMTILGSQSQLFIITHNISSGVFLLVKIVGKCLDDEQMMTGWGGCRVIHTVQINITCIHKE